MNHIPPKCVLCDKVAVTTAAHIPICAEHDRQYREEAEKYLPLEQRKFYQTLLAADEGRASREPGTPAKDFPWIKCSERMPEEGVTVLIFMRERFMQTATGCYDGSGFDMPGPGIEAEEYISSDLVTHWMPLPDPPKGE